MKNTLRLFLALLMMQLPMSKLLAEPTDQLSQPTINALYDQANYLIQKGVDGPEQEKVFNSITVTLSNFGPQAKNDLIEKLLPKINDLILLNKSGGNVGAVLSGCVLALALLAAMDYGPKGGALITAGVAGISLGVFLNHSISHDKMIANHARDLIVALLNLKAANQTQIQAANLK